MNKDAPDEPAGMRRREFLKLMGLGGAALATGCAPEIPDLVPYVLPPESIVPGKATYFATTCRECPAGCGMIAENRDGRIIKLEGNPEHPINRGKLCPRGQAALTGLYNPDRIPQPLQRSENGTVRPISWEAGLGTLSQKLDALRAAGSGARIAFITPVVTGTLKELIDAWLTWMGAGPEAHVMFEPLSYEPLQWANQAVFGQRALPTYRIDESDFLIAFGADFLETWLSTVEYAWRFARFHAPEKGHKNFFVFVGPRRSLTAANADHVLHAAPGREYLAALALIKILLEENAAGHLPPEKKAAIEKIAAGRSVGEAARQSGIAEEQLRRVARRFQEARRPLALAGGHGWTCPNAAETALLANLLNSFKAESLALIDFSQPYALGHAAAAAQVKSLTEKLSGKAVDLLLIHDSNPVFTLPDAWKFGQALEQVPNVVSFSSYPDETSAYAHLHLPAHTFLETWGDYSPKEGIHGLIQPTMGPVFQTRPLMQILIESGFGARRKQEEIRGLDVLQARWRLRWQQRKEQAASFTGYWVASLRQGGRWPRDDGPPSGSGGLPGNWRGVERLSLPSEGRPPPAGAFQAVVYPTIQFYDGRMANRPWIQELPDPVTQITWGGWVEMHPDDARELDLSKGNLVRLQSLHGEVRLPVIPIFTVERGTLAVPIGQGHTNFGRFANALPDNAFRLLPGEVDDKGQIAVAQLAVRLEKLPQDFPIADTDGSYTEQGRHLLQTQAFELYKELAAQGHKPEVTPPLPKGYHPEVDFYPPHDHAGYRWSMIVDLDRCIGCGACVVACYAENNVAFVGRDQMLKMREMSWIRVQRYFKPESWEMGWLVMLCQHCDSAPCESVCPIFAPQHSIEGLNNQVYNRCFGTRFCSQNDPYKVRRFNWFTWRRPKPLDMQLNPEVTVRQKGIMEKCSFCIQRIVAAKVKARNEGRMVRDGDFTTACAQTCPTNALIFGSLLDPESRVSRYIEDARAYQVLHHLNTKPAVIYLKKLTQKL